MRLNKNNIFHNKNCKCGCNKSYIPIHEENQTNRTITIPVPGVTGQKGDKQISLYSKNMSSINPPLLDQVINPIGWSTQPPTLSEGEYRWMSIGYVNSTGTILTEPWSVPIADVSTVNVDPNSPETDDEIFSI